MDLVEECGVRIHVNWPVTMEIVSFLQIHIMWKLAFPSIDCITWLYCDLDESCCIECTCEVSSLAVLVFSIRVAAFEIEHSLH